MGYTKNNISEAAKVKKGRNQMKKQMESPQTFEKPMSGNQPKERLMQKGDAALGIREYMYRVRWTTLCIAAVTFLTHGSILFSQRFGIDTDIIMEGTHNFTLIGRPGLVWLAKFLELDWFNLYLAQIFVLVFMTLLPVSLGYLLYRMSGQIEHLNLSLLVLGLSVVVSPFWVEQIYFLNQSPQVLLVCVLIPVTVLLVEAARTNISQKWYCLILSIALMQVIFACYQTVIMVYITTVTAAFLFSFLKEEYPVKKGLQWICFHGGIFCIGFILQQITSALFYMKGSEYLTSQLSWGKLSTTAVLINCLKGIVRSLTIVPPYYTGMYGVFCLLLIGASLYIVIRKKERKYLLFLAAEAFLMFTPYVFSFYFGSEVRPRMQLVMPLSQGCILYLTVLLCDDMKDSDTGADKKILQILNLRTLRRVVALVLAVCLYRDTLSHLGYCTRFYYTDEWQYRYSNYMAEAILSEIENVKKQNGLDSSYDKILFLGSPDIPYNRISFRGDVIGVSSFCWDVDYLTRNRIGAFYRNTGHPLYISFADGESAAFHAYFRDYFGDAVDMMCVWPDTGCVQYLQNDEIGLNYIVVKLGHNWGNIMNEN